MKYLKKLIQKHISIEEYEWKDLNSRFQRVEFKRGDLISRARDIFEDFYFIKSGIARSYFTDIDGKDFTWQLYFRGKSRYGLNLFMDDSVSYYEKSGSMLYFEVLEDAVFYKISLKNMDEFLKISDKKWEYLARIWIHDTYFSSTYKRTLSLMSESAKKRYERVLDEYPDIFKGVKSYHIASFLGITPQTLSRLRR
jgi:CRP-like cAMP-binding protein